MAQRTAAYFNVGDVVTYGKYQNKKGKILSFGDDGKGNPTVTIEPVPKGQKKSKVIPLFRIRRVKDKTAANVALRLRVAQRYAAQVIRKEGLCGFCKRRIRTPDDKLALHGYKRPGTGRIQGNCPGVGHPPMEISPITAEIAREYFQDQVDSARKDLSRLTTAKEIPNPWFPGRDPFKKNETPEWEWDRALAATKVYLEQDLTDYTFELKERQEMLRGWKPKALTEITEESKHVEQKKKQDRVYQNRMDRYNTLKEKVLGRLDKAFENVKKREAKAKQKPTANNYKAVASAANTIYSIVDSAIDKLWEVHPEGYYNQVPSQKITREGIMADLNRDRVWKYMGILESNRYHIGKRDPHFKKLYEETSSANYGWSLRDKPDDWRPTWPGYRP